MSNIITIIAYMPSGYQSTRGYVTDQWGSDFQLTTFDNISDAIDHYGKLVIQDQNEKLGGYEFHILIDGKDEHFINAEDEVVRDEVREGGLKILQAHIDAEAEILIASEARKKEETKEKERMRKAKELEDLKNMVSHESIEENKARIKKLEEELKEE